MQASLLILAAITFIPMYATIAVEHPLKISKSVIALMIGSVLVSSNACDIFLPIGNVSRRLTLNHR